MPTGLPASVDISPNGRHLAAVVEGADSGVWLNVWRLDGQMPAQLGGPTPPAAARPR